MVRVVVVLGVVSSLAVGGVAVGATSASAATSATVAKDGSGNFRTVQAAINAVPANNTSRFTITIKPGTYHEIVAVPSNSPSSRSSVPPAGPRTWSSNYDNASGTPKPGGGTYGTAGSASVTISGHDFTARAPDVRQHLQRGGAP